MLLRRGQLEVVGKKTNKCRSVDSVSGLHHVSNIRILQVEPDSYCKSERRQVYSRQDCRRYQFGVRFRNIALIKIENCEVEPRQRTQSVRGQRVDQPPARVPYRISPVAGWPTH